MWARLMGQGVFLGPRHAGQPGAESSSWWYAKQQGAGNLDNTSAWIILIHFRGHSWDNCQTGLNWLHGLLLSELQYWSVVLDFVPLAGLRWTHTRLWVCVCVCHMDPINQKFVAYCLVGYHWLHPNPGWASFHPSQDRLGVLIVQMRDIIYIYI